MIIDLIQQRNSVEISYIDENNNIKIDDILLKNGYYKYVCAEEFETEDIVENLRSFKENKKIKRVPARRFKNHNINEFINFDLKRNHQDLYKELTALRIPLPFSVDIEVLPTDEHGYSHQTEALNPITSISITDINMGSLQFIVENPEHPTISDADLEVVNNKIKTLFGDSYQNFPIQVRVFKTEYEMLQTFLECIRKYFTSVIGWNFIGYDWTYIYHRCVNIGLDVRLASPKNQTKNKNIKANKKNKNSDGGNISIKMPTHRIIADYMQLFKEALIYNNLGSYSLDNIANDILGIGKISYAGNLRTLYKDDFLGFLAYGFVDTILVMLIHKKTKLYDVDFFESHLNKIPYLMISQNGISNALVYNQLRSENIFLPEQEFNEYPKQKYPGGYVKLPILKVVLAIIGVDYSALYPNEILTYGISPERYVDTIKINEVTKRPLNVTEEQKWFMYKQQNCILSPTGRIYSKNNAQGIEEYGLYPKIEERKQVERGIFKNIKKKIYLDILTKIDDKLKTHE